MNVDSTGRGIELAVQGLDRPARLDRVLRERFPEWGRQAVGALIHGRNVEVNGRVVWLSSWQVRNGDRLVILQTPPSKPAPITAFDDKWTISDDGDLIAVNKPAGLLAHAVRLGQECNLLSLARVRFGRVTLFHRLDRDTSGVQILARSRSVNRHLDTVFKTGLADKRYLALVATPSRLPSEGTVRRRIAPHPQRRHMMTIVKRGGQAAVTHFRVVGEAAGQQLLLLKPETGRTHQLRLHLAAEGAPILGDRLYGMMGTGAQRLMLHAARISWPAVESLPGRAYSAALPVSFLESMPEALREWVRDADLSFSGWFSSVA